MAQQLPPIPSTANQGPHLASTFDQYFDLSTRRFDHLERPFLLRNVVESTAAMDEGAFIAYCRSKILKGDPLGGRDVVPDFEGSSTQRGGLMVFSNFELLRFQQTAPRFDGTAFHGTNGVGIAADLSYTRRSDALFCQQLVERHGVDCQLKRRLAVLHCNESDAVASPQKMRSLEVQEILGAMVCRKPSDRIAFVEQRLLALEMNVWRIRGIAQTLRGRPKGHQSLALLAFLDELDVIFRPSTWQEEVTLVVRREAKRLCDWAIQIREINVVEGDTRLCSVDGALGALCLPYLKTTDATRAIVTRLFPVQQAHTGTEKHLGTVILTTMSLLRNSRLLKLDLSLENFERPETMVMAKGAWLQLDTLKENDEVKTLLLDAMCKQAFFCFRFAKWGQAHLLDHCTALSAILPWNIASRTTQTYNRLTGFDNFMKLLVLAEDFDITTRTPSQCHSRYFPTGHMIIDPTSFSNDASLAAFVLKTHVSAAVDASVHMVIEDPFWQFAPANQEPNTRRSLSYLTRLLRRTGFVIEKEESVETIDPRHFEIYVSHHVFTLRKLPTAQDMPKVALMIKTCPLDYTTIVPNVQHIISTLDTCNFSEIVLLVDRSRSNDFLRQFVDNIDLQQYDAALTQIRAERLVDRVIDFDGSCKEMDPSQINHRWFGKDHPATHSEQGAQYASTFYGFEQIEADLILQTDSDIIFTGRAEIARINLLRKYSELFAADEAMLTAGFPIVTTNPAPLGWRHLCMVANEYDGLESTYPLEVRCSFIHRGRLLKCLPFKIPDYAAGESHSPFLINKQLEGWYRVVDANIRSSGGRLRSYRGSIGLESGFVHPPNTIKADLMRYMFIVDRIACTPRRAPTVTCNKADSVERNIIHSESKQDPRWREQLDHVELQHTIDWFSERAEDIIFVCCGFRHSAARVLRCLESIARQRGISECGVIVLDDATENYGDVRECIRSKALELFGAHRVSCISTGVHNGFLANTTHSILNSCCNPESIIVTLDQDDMLLGDNVVTYIQQIFSSDPNVECAIGGGVRTDTPQTFPLNVQNPRLNRGGGNTWQHLRAFRKHLFSRIKPGDMKDSSGKWIDFAADWVFMIPIVEMAKKTFAIPPDAALYLFEPSEAPRDGVEANGARSDQEERISVTAALLQARCSYARCTDWEETFLPTELCGGCHFRVCPPSDGVQVCILYKGMDLVGQCNVPVRIHSECLTGDVLSSEKCDCGQQRNNFLKRLDEEANGVFIYIKGHEGRGAGLLNKVRAYGLMDKDPELHHNSALKCCGCESDTRNYHQAMCALQELGMASILLHTNNQFKVEAAKLVFGAECVHKVGIPSVPTQSSHKYLSEKEQDCGHIGLLSEEDSAAAPRSGSMLSTVEVGGSSCERKGGANQANPVDDPAMLDGQEVSTQSYAISDVSTGAKGWYDDHGWTVIRDVLPQAACGELIRATEDHKKECAAKSTRKNAEGKHVHIPYDEYRKEISQHRDLHLLREQGVTCFVDTLRKAALDIVLPLTGWSGATLFHDHVINKPRGGSNGAIPGHQDSMFWPIDRPGISVWLALEDIGPTGGCLEVVDQSHKSGTCEDPVDFMAKEVSFSNRFPGVPQFRLPAKAGSAVLLDSLTFHRSSPNQDLDGDRFVYLMLFVPFCARWEPALVDWHPINSHLMQSKFPEHERLRLEALRHPSFGTCGDNDDCCKATPTPLHCGTHAGEEGITMYNAAPKTTTQLKQILGELNSSKSGAELLTDETVYEQVFEVLRQTAVCQESQRADAYKVLERVRTCFVAYEQNRARNVYNLAFKDWWELAGESWESRHLFATSKLTIDEVTTYLDRIGVTYDDCSRTCDLAFLTDIVRGTLASIPFQNFTMLREVPRTRPTKAQIVDAMLTGVGGLCSVRNTFLYLLLRTLGYAVQFLSCTIHLQTDASLLENAHMALLVTIGTDSYWLDIGNGFPYKTPLSLSAAGGTDDQKAPVIDHSYISVRLVRRSQKFHIEHRLAGSCEWKTNNTFDAPQDSPTPFVHFDDLHFNHYNPSKRFLGPFLNSLRFNVWARDDSFLVIRFDACEGTPPSSFTIIEKSKQGGSIEKLFDQSKECARSRIFISVATRDWRESLQREGLRSTWKFAILMQDAWNTLCCK